MGDPFKAIKKPIEVDAWEIFYHPEKNFIPEWARFLTEWRREPDEPPVLYCYCETGLQKARIGDYLIKGYLNDICIIPRLIFLGSYARA